MQGFLRRAGDMQARSLAFLRDNLPALMAFLFLVIAGIASGITSAQLLYAGRAASLLASLPMALAGDCAILPLLLLPLLTHGALALAGLLCGLTAPAVLLWPVALWARGFLLGAALYLGVSALPSWEAVLLLVFLQLEGGLLLPCLLALYASAGKTAVQRIRAGLAANAPVRAAFSPRAALRPCLGLMACGLLEGAVLPLALRALAAA